MSEEIQLSSDELDTLLRTFSHHHSRAVCYHFRTHTTEAASVDELVKFILEQEKQDADETNVKIHLHHATLPKLTDAGFIDYDQRSKTVRYRDSEPVNWWFDQVVEKSQIPL